MNNKKIIENLDFKKTFENLEQLKNQRDKLEKIKREMENDLEKEYDEETLLNLCKKADDSLLEVKNLLKYLSK